MDAKAPPSAPQMPDTPTGLESTVGDHDGQLDLSWDPVSGAKSYVIQQSADPPAATSWTHDTTSTKSSTTVDGLTSGTRYWFRVSAVGPRGRVGSYRFNLSQMGSKLQAVGTSLFCYTHPDVKVVYATPREYNASLYSEGCKQMHVLDLGPLAELRNRLDRVGTLRIEYDGAFENESAVS
jgi:hypothetical protein